jgi:PAS domain S-box-containing protein
MKEKIEQRVIGLFVLMVGILVFTAYSAMKTIQQNIDSKDFVNKTHAVITEVNAVLSSLHAGDSALRTYLMTGDPRDQGAYRSAYAEMLEHLAVAKALTTHGSEKDLQNAQIVELEDLISNRVAFTKSVVQARVQGGLDAARDVMTAHPEVEPMGKIQRLVKNITEQEMSLLRERDEEAHLAAQATRATVYTGVAVNFVLFVFVAWLMRDDINTRRRNAQILEEANAQLEIKVKERTAELVKANQTLKQENLERRWSSQALDHQLRYSQLIINSIQELVFVISRALNISRINPAVSRQSGWEPQELVAQSLERILKLPADPQSGQNPIVFAMHEGREIQDREAEIITKTGRTAPMRFSMVPLRDHDKVVGAVITVRMQNGPQPRA